MTRSRSVCRIAAACALGLGLFSGCASGAGRGWAGLFPNRKMTDEEQVETPSERIETLRKLAESADRAEATEKERIAGQLAAAVPGETDPLVRAQLIRTLGHYPGTPTLSTVAAALDDGERDVRIAACESLGRLGGPDATEKLSATIASDADPDVRLAALRAAGELDDPNVVSGIAIALDDPDPALQLRAMRSLEQVTGKQYGNDVQLWRAYAAGEAPTEPDISVAERLRQLF
jgi:HEAT repeat protein